MPRTYYSVHPRFSCGSGAQVSEEIALTVAAQEKEHYEMALTGAFGEDDLDAARQPDALRGIVEAITESKGGWNVVDLITGEKFWRGPVKASKVQVGDRLLEERATVTKVPAPFTGRLSGRVSLFGERTDGHGAFYKAYGSSEELKIERKHKEP
jgi:hypothetical protein